MTQQNNWWEAAPRADERNQMWWSAAPLDASTPQAAPQAPQAPAPRTTAEQLGLGTRATAQGLLGLPGLVYDVAAVPQNLLSNVPGLEWMRAKPAAQQVSEAATAIGLPEPRDAGERIMGAAIQGAAALPTGYGLGGAVRQGSGAAGQRLADVLQAAPVQQAVMGVAGGAGSQAAQEVLPEGASPAAKAVAGVAGGVAGAAAPSLALGAARRVVTPLPARLTEEERRLVQVAQREGVDLPVGAQTGSPRIKMAESALARLPGSAGAAQDQQQRMREQFQGAVMRTTGEAATDVRPETLDRAFGRIGQQFDDLAAQTTINLDQQFATELGGIARNYANRLPTDVQPVVVSRLQDLAARVGGTMAGPEFQNVSSDLRRAARDYQARPDVARALNEMAAALDDAVERSIGPALRGEWRQTRQQYRNLLAINEAASRSAEVDRSRGFLSPGALQQAVRSQDTAGYGRGRGQLNDLARLGGFIADKIPNSGTAERTMMSSALSLAPIGGGGLIGTMTGNPILGAAAGAAAPWAVQRALQSAPGRAYLTNQLMAGPTPLSGDARRAALINALQQGISP